MRLTDRDIGQYYYGFSNRGLWPLSHYFVGRCQFRADQWQSYRRVNETFATALLEELPDRRLRLGAGLPPGAGAGLRARRCGPTPSSGSSGTSRFPEPSVFGIMPWRDDVLAGMLGSDVIGFHLESYARNFLACVERFLGLDVDWVRGSVQYQDREVRAVAYPIGIDAEPVRTRSRATPTSSSAAPASAVSSAARV